MTDESGNGPVPDQHRLPGADPDVTEKAIQENSPAVSPTEAAEIVEVRCPDCGGGPVGHFAGCSRANVESERDDLRVRVRNSNLTIKKLAEEVETLDSRTLELRDIGDRLAVWAKVSLDPDVDAPAMEQEQVTSARDALARWERSIGQVLAPSSASAAVPEGQVTDRSNEDKKADEDALIPLIVRDRRAELKDRFTPRMAARQLLDTLDRSRAALGGEEDG